MTTARGNCSGIGSNVAKQGGDTNTSGSSMSKAQLPHQHTEK